MENTTTVNPLKAKRDLPDPHCKSCIHLPDNKITPTVPKRCYCTHTRRAWYYGGEIWNGCECGKGKRLQYDYCYTCNQKRQEKALADTNHEGTWRQHGGNWCVQLPIKDDELEGETCCVMAKSGNTKVVTLIHCYEVNEYGSVYAYNPL